MKTFSELKSYLLEHIRTPKADSPKFQKLDDSYLKSRPLKLETKSFRFHIKDHSDPKDKTTGLVTVHDSAGNHVGSMSYSRLQKSGHVISELTKDKSCKHDHMMAEVMSHLNDHHGYKFFGSHTVSSDGERPWASLAKHYNVHVLEGKTALKKVKSSVTPESIIKGDHVQKGLSPDSELLRQYYLGAKK